MDAPIKFAVGFGVGAVIIALGISAIGGALAVQRLDTAANHIKDVIVTDGVYDDSTQEEATGYLRRANIPNATVSVSSSAGDVATMSLGDRFTVDLSQPVKIGVGNIGITLTIPGHADGISGVYRK